ncbi:MAG: 4-hydroxybenzoate decarboxylase [Pirellulaceae bacterium]|nr:MAG: 4-hydroxybenzoate decarboxylase [Pirellulaceae bacterium]
MHLRGTQQVTEFLRRRQQLIVVEQEVDPHLELAEIHRRVYRHQGPALLFTKVRHCPFPVATNLFGTLERAHLLFEKTWESVRQAVRWKLYPEEAVRRPWQALSSLPVLLHMRPRAVRDGKVLERAVKISVLPQVTCWPLDGGPFITLPQVMSRAANASSWSGLNLGMYRIQLAGNDYIPDQEVGLHYQIHRGIGVHHAAALAAGKPFRVTITVGGTPAMTLAAVMPLPEGMSELMFAGALAGHRIPLIDRPHRPPLYADADFAIEGTVIPGVLKPEGPFGDHLGYYAKKHPFPVLRVEKVWHRADAVWPMTVVGRPPQEDTVFGQLIHQLTGPVIPTVLPGVREVHAVDAAGVHPLLLALGSERYTPYQPVARPQELLTQACAILGQGQLSLAKYLWIVDEDGGRAPRPHAVADFLQWALQRVDWSRDLHFITHTTIDTLDYSGEDLNRGSKLIIAACGPAVRELPTTCDNLTLPPQWRSPSVGLPGVLVVEAPPHQGEKSKVALQAICDDFPVDATLNRWPLVILVDDSRWTTQSLENLLWVTFTRSNPAADVYGVGAFQRDKHFGCRGSLVVDARRKPHHAEPLMESPEVSRKIDAMAARGGELAKYL